MPCANAASDGRVPATAVGRRRTCCVPAMDLACTWHAQPRPVGPLRRPYRRRRLGRHHRPAPDCKRPSAQRRPGAFDALRSTGCVDGVGSVTCKYATRTARNRARLRRRCHRHLPGSCRVARREAHAACPGPPRPRQDVSHPGPEEPPRPARQDRPPGRDADTRSGCQFASQRASLCAFLLRPVPPAPLFTLADASLILPMGSQTDTSTRSIERLSGRAGVRGAALRQRRLTQRRPHAATGEDLRWTPGRSPG